MIVAAKCWCTYSIHLLVFAFLLIHLVALCPWKQKGGRVDGWGGGCSIAFINTVSGSTVSWNSLLGSQSQHFCHFFTSNSCVIKLFVLHGTTFNIWKCTSKFTKLQLLTTIKQHGYADKKNYIDPSVSLFSTAGGGGSEKVLWMMVSKVLIYIHVHVQYTIVGIAFLLIHLATLCLCYMYMHALTAVSFLCVEYM